MSIVAMSSIGIVNVDDGQGISSVEIKYAISSSATTPPGNPISDGGTIVVDIDGRPLTDGDWQTAVPEVPNGYYLWTRTVTYYTGGDFSIAYAVGYTGEDGSTGQTGVSITGEKEQWYLSSSNSELSGGSWSDTEPASIPDGKYLWGRIAFTMSDGTTQYSNAVYRSTIAGIKNITDELNRKITQKIWASDITTSIDQYDNSTETVMYDRFSSVEQDIGEITSTVGEMQSTIDSQGTAIETAQTTASQTATKFSWLVQDGSTASSVTYTANALTAMANQIDLTGKVTFNSFGSTLQSRITNTEAATRVYTGTCSTAAGTAAKVVSCDDTSFALVNGVSIKITFSTASTADAPTINVKSTGAKAIYFDNAVTSSSNRFRWQAGSVITFQYNGTNWVVTGFENADYFTSSTAAGTAAKTASATGTFVLCRGTTITMYSSTANSADVPTLNVGSTGAFSIYYKNAVTSSSNKYLWDAGQTITFTFNGSYWYVNDGGAQMVKAYSKSAVDWVSSNGATSVTAASIMKQWVDDATLATTTIDGGYIKAHTIESTQLATDAIMSNNYEAASDTSSPFSATGTFLDLETGSLYMPNFGVNGSTGAAYFNGTVNATAGKFGDQYSYWDIETVYDYNNVAHATLVGIWPNDTQNHPFIGSPYIQTGNWQISDTAVATRNYVSGSGTSNKATYFKDTATNTYYDVGMKIPTDFSTTDTTSVVTQYNRSFFYGRKAAANQSTGDPPTLDSGWTYLFMADTEGNLYEQGEPLSKRYAGIGAVANSYVSVTGGTINGNLTVTGTITGNASSATKLKDAVAIKTNLASNSAASLDGTNSSITPGVSGTLGVGNGGTGKASWTQWGIVYASATNTLAQVGAGTSGQILKSNGSAAPGWVNQSSLSVGSATNATNATNDSDGNQINTTYRKMSDNTFTGAVSFTGGLSGDLTGTASNAVKVGNKLTIQLNSGTTEGTNKFTFDGSAAKNINLTKSSIGLGNVENTADASKSVASAGKWTTARTITIGSTGKSVDGTGDVSWSLSEIGAVDKTGDTMSGSLTLSLASPVLKISSTGDNAPEFVLERSSGNKSSWKIINSGGVMHIQNNWNNAKVAYFNVVSINHTNGNVTFKSGSTVTATTFVGALTGNASTATTATSAGKLTTGRDFTIGNTTKQAVDWSAAVSFTKADISGEASSSSNGWMSAADKNKLDSITVSDIGTVGANSIVGATNGGITVTINNGVATVKHSNQLSNSGTAQGTANGTTLTNGGTFNIPKINYDINGHVTSTGTNTLTLPNITTITGNAGSATQLQTSRNISVGAKTNSFNGTAAISFPTADMGIIRNDLVPIETKTYTGLLGTADNNAASDSFYFMQMRPTDFYAQWKIRLRVTATISGQNNYRTTTDVTYFGVGQATAPNARSINQIYSTSYRPIYYINFYRLTSAGYTGGYSNAIGVGLRASNSRNTAGYERTIKVEVLEYENCTYSLLETPIKWAQWAGNTTTNYAGLTETNACDNGIKQTGDNNDTTTVGLNNTRFVAGTNGMKQYSIVMQDANGTWQSFTTGSGTGTTKTRNTVGFKLGQMYYFYTSSNYAAGATTGTSQVRKYSANIDFRYSLNCGTTLVGNQPVWIVGTLNNGLFYLDATWWTQTLPTTADGKIYIYLGVVTQESTITAGYRGDFQGWQGAYYHNGTDFVPYVEAAVAYGYAKLSGATYTGEVRLANNIWNRVGDDVQIGDINKAGHLGVQGVNGNTGIFFTTYNQTTKSTGGAITWDGSKFSITGTVDTSISGNAATATSATKATQDGSGNTITSYYCTLSTTQTLSGAKTFSAATSFTNTTASTSKTTGAVKVSGGVGVAGRMSANEVEVNNGCVLQFDSNLSCLNFIFN